MNALQKQANEKMLDLGVNRKTRRKLLFKKNRNFTKKGFRYGRKLTRKRV